MGANSASRFVANIWRDFLGPRGTVVAVGLALFLVAGLVAVVLAIWSARRKGIRKRGRRHD